MSRERIPYSYGSTAEKINQELLYEKQLHIAKKKRQKQNAVYKLRISVLAVIIFACLTVITIQYAEIAKISYSVDSLNTEYKNLVNDNTLMSVKIDSAMNLESLRQKAQEELGMVKPNKSNIIYVNVPKPDVKNNTNDNAPGTGNIDSGFINQISKLLGFGK